MSVERSNLCTGEYGNKSSSSLACTKVVVKIVLQTGFFTASTKYTVGWLYILAVL